MNAMLLFVLVSALLLSRGEAQAPGDGNSACPQSYPDTWRVLMDSWRYKELLDDSTAVWEESSQDGDEDTWTPGVGGLCKRDVRSCTYFEGTQNNWVFTQHISKDIPAGQPSNYPVRVFVNITYSPVGCASGCTRRFDVYRYLVGTPQTRAIQRDTSRYSLFQQIPTSGNQEVTEVLNFDLSQNQNGFYLAFRDPDTCININRVIIYRNRCPQRQTGLVLYSERPAPSTQTQSFQASCVPNAMEHPTSSLSVTCTSEGEWVGSPQCQCNGGYRSTGSACEACPARTYSTNPPSTSCSSCPANTVTTEVAASICSCLDGFYRAPGETASNDCTSPPTAVTSLTVIRTTDTTATLRWERPAITGRDDFYYVISHSDPDGPDFIVFNDMYVNRDSTVTLTVTGLEPDTRYTFRIATANGVSDLNPEGAPLRISEISGITDEGRPGAPVGVQGLCNVVVWQAPNQPNGVITGYDVRFTTEGGEREVLVSKSATESFHVVVTDNIPAGSGAVLFQVRAETSAGKGTWSDLQGLGCDSTDVSDCSSLPGKIEEVIVFGSVVVWVRPPAECLSGYDIRINSTGRPTADVQIVPLDANKHWYNVSEDQRPARVEVRGVNINGVGDWSDLVTVSAVDATGGDTSGDSSGDTDDDTDGDTSDDTSGDASGDTDGNTDSSGQVDVKITSISAAASFAGGVLLTLALVFSLAGLYYICRRHKEGDRKTTSVHNPAYDTNNLYIDTKSV